MAATVKVLQQVLASTETLVHKRISCEVVAQTWDKAETKEGFVEAMQVMFKRMVRYFDRFHPNN